MSWNDKHSRYMGPATAGAVLFGVVVGGVAAAAANVRKVQDGKMTRQEAALDALREAGTTGISTGAGVAAMCRLGVGGFAGLVGITVVAAGTKYLLDSVVREVLDRGCKACASGGQSTPAATAEFAESAAPAPKGKASASAKLDAKPAARTTLKATAKPAAKTAAKPAARAKSAKPRAPKKAPAMTEPGTGTTE